MPTVLPPMRLLPIFQEKVWGGRNLSTHLGKPLPGKGPIGESWELADLAAGRSMLETERGPLSLTEASFRYGQGLFGPGNWDPFPLLYKFIDAHQDLSVQVHPDDHLARKLAGEDWGKTECWVILDAPPHAELYLGLAEGASPIQLFRSIEEGDPEPFLGRVPVKAGDVIPIPAGTLHAISGGLVLAELQQSSDLTYRIWDWGRMDLDGKARPLHLREAWQCLRAEPPRGPLVPLAHPEDGAARELAALCPHFALERLQASEEAPLALDTEGSRFEVLSVLSGSAECRFAGDLRSLGHGESWLVPARTGGYELIASGSDCLVLRFYLDPEGPDAVLRRFGTTADSAPAKELCF